MATKKKMLQAAAGNAAASGGAGGLDVSEVFSTYLYDGNSSSSTTTTQKITNDIDLSTEGGLVWIKKRNGTAAHALVDTERGGNKELNTAASTLETTADSSQNIAFNTDGFTMTGYYLYNATINKSSETYASWTFRKAPKFFDVQTWSGTTGSRTISHDLNGTVGCIIFKRRDSNDSWWVVHRASSGGFGDYYTLDTSNASNPSSGVSNVTSSSFDVSSYYNGSGSTWVAYIFAHNDGDGDFGDGTQDIIKCGSYTGNGSTDGPEIDLGFEPQWIMVKRTDSTSPWTMWDVMRGLANNGTSDDRRLKADTSDAESNSPFGHPTSTGFTITGTNGDYNASGGPYIYIAIRRGPMAVPTDATEVFKTVVPTANQADSPTPYWNSGFAVDMALHRHNAGSSGISHLAFDRLRGDSVALATDQTTDESSAPHSMFISGLELDHSEGVHSTVGYGAGSGSEDILHMWQRRPNYFDVVAYTGTGSARTVSHNLGVAPEMMWVKRRNVSNGWKVYHSSLGAGSSVALNETVGEETNGDICWNSTAPTDSVFSLGSISDVNGSGSTYIAYLFASLDGVSKVGSITGTGSDQTIDCGFSSGARFVLIKKTSAGGDWWLFDAERGIAVGNDPLLRLNTTDAEQNTDVIDPHSSGFIAKGSVFGSGESFIFYAIA